MACKSSCSRQMTWKYDVFVSFRGDTRNNFTDHLFGALHRKGILAFRDDTNLKRGEPISPELLQAIEGSRASVVVFSKNYASSTWCLRELAKIADCSQGSASHVLPVFYDVNPSEVRKQSGNYEKAFVEHEERFKEDLDMLVQVRKWREALTQVANLSGWDVRDKPQYMEIEKIVSHIIRILGDISSSLVNDLVGIQSPVEELAQHLHLGSNSDVRMVGICGMGGIGKTTIATILYDKISHEYDACCFINDVNNIYQNYGVIGVQKELLYQILNEENLQICNLSKGAHLIRSRLHHLRVFIVLDNVYQVEQLEKLAINREWLAGGSRIIIISRDGHILKEHGVDIVYNVQLLNKDNALQLFCRKAFKCHDILIGYEQLTYDILNYVNGLPLAIKVWGSFLFDRDESEWRSALARLKETPRKDIMDVLRISFDGLEDTEKEIFLDIACFFNGYGKKYVKNILDCCGFHSDIGVRVLMDKSLISEKNWIIHMHDLLRELGMSIIREKSPNEPGKWSRLWCYKDFHNVMFENEETKHIEAIFLKRYGENQYNTTLKAGTLSQMRHIRLLILQNKNISGSLNYLSNELRYLEWDKCSLTYFPSNFQPDNLVELILSHSSIKQLWEDIKPLHNLRNLNLFHSKDLIKVPDFRTIPNLKNLNLEGCIKLVQIHKSIGLLQKLKSLNLKDCKNLVSIPNNIVDLRSLEVLNISGCLKLLNNQPLKKALHVAKYLKLLDIREIFVQCQPAFSIYKILMMPFHFLYSKWCEDSIGLLLPSLPTFPCLRDLDLSFCNLLQVPDAIGSLHGLERLNLGGNNFARLPCNIKMLHKLISLNLEHCNQLESLPELPSSTILPVRRSELRIGIYIFNCPNLGNMEHCSRMTFSWMIQILQLWSHSSISPHIHVPFHLNEIVIPGSQIPRWFNNQSVGSSISLDSLPIMHDCNWIGIACCVAFVARDDPTNLRNERKPFIGCGFECKEGGWYPLLPIHLQKEQVTIEIDHHHLWLLFFPREEFIAMLSQITKTNDLEILQLATTLEDPPGLRLEVQNCGFRWVFKHDLEQFNLTTMHSISSKGMEIHDHFSKAGNYLIRKRKFFTIDD